VKALGFFLESRRQAQVSINLTDFEVTPLCTVIEAVRAEAERRGVNVAGMELIGLIPRKALETAGTCNPEFENFNPDLILENRLAKVG
jgi:glutamate formiminotransferase